MKGTTSASDDKEKCDSGKDGDVVDESGNTNGNRRRWSVMGVRRLKGFKGSQAIGLRIRGFTSERIGREGLQMQ